MKPEFFIGRDNMEKLEQLFIIFSLYFVEKSIKLNTKIFNTKKLNFK